MFSTTIDRRRFIGALAVSPALLADSSRAEAATAAVRLVTTFNALNPTHQALITDLADLLRASQAEVSERKNGQGGA